MNDAMTLVTRFLLDPRNYESGTAMVGAASRRAGEAVEALRGGIMGGLQSALRSVFSPIAALASGAGIMALAHSAVAAAIGFDTIQRSLAAVTKDAERAKTILRFDDKLAGPSIFTSEELAQASLTLEAFKLTTERFLPVAEKLGTVFGGNAESLRQYVDALGYIKNGRFGEGFESLSRAGLSKDDFKAKGLTFNKGGEYTGQADQALDAIEKIVNERFGKLSQEMADGPAAKMASVMDAIGRAARVAGYNILSILAPALERAGNFIAYLVDSGVIQKAVDGISALFSGKDFGEFLVQGVAWLVATLMHVPEIVSAIGGAFHALFTWLRENLLAMGRLFVQVWAFKTVYEGMVMIVGAIRAIQAAEKGLGIIAAATEAIMTGGIAAAAGLAAGVAAAYLAGKAFDKLAPNAGNLPVFQPIENVFGAIAKDKDKMVTGFEASQGNGSKPGDPGAAPATVTGPLNAIANHAQKISRNTDKMAEVQDKVLGGGTVGKGAADAVNIDKALRGTGSGGGGDKIERAVQLIREAMTEASGGMIVAAAYQSRTGR